MMRFDRSAVRMLRAGPPGVREDLAQLLTQAVPPSILRFVAAYDVAIRPLFSNEDFPDVSPALSDVGFLQAHPIQPPGLYVPEEKTLYLRSVSALVVGHELMHAVDDALGGTAYYSTRDVAIGRAFTRAKAFVTPYASEDVEEYFAECGRAMLGMNDPDLTSWPLVDEQRLRSVDPAMWRIMLELFERVALSEPA
jgi:hypothetical protein